jgi:hypothetical protein
VRPLPIRRCNPEHTGLRVYSHLRVPPPGSPRLRT